MRLEHGLTRSFSFAHRYIGKTKSVVARFKKELFRKLDSEFQIVSQWTKARVITLLFSTMEEPRFVMQASVSTRDIIKY